LTLPYTGPIWVVTGRTSGLGDVAPGPAPTKGITVLFSLRPEVVKHRGCRPGPASFVPYGIDVASGFFFLENRSPGKKRFQGRMRENSFTEVRRGDRK